MAYTTIDDPSVYFQTAIWSGTGSALSVTFDGNSDMQPDMVWVKNRTTASDHRLSDSVRGTSSHLVPNDDAAIDTSSTALTAFNSDGFSVGSEQSYSKSGSNHVGWGWKAGTSFTNDASSTSIGTIDSTGSVNNDSGFSIVSYTGNATDNASVKHGLNTAPKMVIIKDLSDTSTWGVWHQSLTNGGYKLTLNTTAAQADDSAFIGGGDRAIPTSSVFFLGSGGGGNGANANIAYCFAEKQGYSKFGSYTGNGNADGTFVYTGFKPAFVMVKRTDATNYWFMFDNKRSSSGSNPTDKELYANDAAAEDTSARFDFLSNGFKNRISSAGSNASGGTYIYMAFAESPFISSSSVPTTAR